MLSSHNNREILGSEHTRVASAVGSIILTGLWGQCVIGFFVTNKHRYTIEILIDDWAPSLRDSVKVLPYEHLTGVPELPPATYIFSDLERLLGDHLEFARQLHARAVTVEGTRTLNDPSRSLTRYDLLRTLKVQGINDFNVYRLSETRSPDRWPVFIRSENEHNGSLTPLLHDQAELDRAIARLYIRRRSLERLLMVEFCDTSAGSGVFKKYAAFVVGSHVIPKHLFFSEGWSVKHSEIVGQDEVQAEVELIETNPHADALQSIFAAAGISYGRVDYGVLEDRLQVWEINTNPMLMTPRGRSNPARLPPKLRISDALAEAFRSIDGPDPDPSRWASVLHEPRFNYVRARLVLRRRIGSHQKIRRIYHSIRPRRARILKGVDRVAGLVWKPVMKRLKRTQWH